MDWLDSWIGLIVAFSVESSDNSMVLKILNLWGCVIWIVARFGLLEFSIVRSMDCMFARLDLWIVASTIL